MQGRTGQGTESFDFKSNQWSHCMEEKEEDTFLCDSVGSMEPRGKGYRQIFGWTNGKKEPLMGIGHKVCHCLVTYSCIEVGQPTLSTYESCGSRNFFLLSQNCRPSYPNAKIEKQCLSIPSALPLQTWRMETINDSSSAPKNSDWFAYWSAFGNSLPALWDMILTAIHITENLLFCLKSSSVF